jgi:hypothetical protein
MKGRISAMVLTIEKPQVGGAPARMRKPPLVVCASVKSRQNLAVSPLLSRYAPAP